MIYLEALRARLVSYLDTFFAQSCFWGSNLLRISQCNCIH